MKNRYISLFCPTAFLLTLSLSNLNAASGSWTTASSGDWSESGNWTGGLPNAVGETATFNQNWTGQIINVNGEFIVGSILATDSTSGGGLTISGGKLILGNAANKPIISTNSNNAFSETAATRLKLTSVLDGTNGFERQGSGYLDLSGTTNLFTGSIKLTALASGGGSFTVINGDANLGDSSNTIEVVTNSQPVGFYNDAAAGSFTLNSARTITTTGTGDLWVKNKSGANMTIAGVISGTANFRKNDGGIVTLTGENTYALATKLEGGILRLSGGNNRLPTTTSVQFLNGTSTLDLTNTTQSVAAISAFGGGTSTITGAGGSLTVTNNANFTVNGADATTLDMSGLTNFTYNQSSKNFVVQPVTSLTSSKNAINLAKAGINEITALNVTVGGASGTSQGTAHEGRLYLGTSNNINATTVSLGGFNGSGLVAFQSGLSTRELKMRGLTGGTSRVDNVFIGSTSSGSRSGDGVMNLSEGNLDAVVNNLIINRHGASATTTHTSSLTMGGGNVDASNIVLARKSTNFGTGADTTGNPVLNANFIQDGGTVKVSNMVMGDNTNSDTLNILPVLNPTYHLNGGTLYAAVIDGGAGGFNSISSIRNFNLNGGTLRNYDSATDLTVDGVDASAGGRLNVNVTATSTIHTDVGRTITLGENARLNGSGALTKSGDSMLVINSVSNTYMGTLGVNAGTLAGQTTLGGTIVLGSGGIIAPGNSIGTIGAESLTWDGGAVMSFELSNSNNTSDLLALTNGFSKGIVGSHLFDFNGTGLLGETYTLVTFTSTNFDVTDFSYSNLGGGHSGEFSISGNDLQFSVIPEPSTGLVGLLGLLSVFRRRRTLTDG